jgi:esterase/lipase superfamily enzyme
MRRDYHSWFSPALGRQMELLVFGHAGAPALVFPTSMGRFYEFEDRGMIAALAWQIEQGWLQLFCVDSLDGETFYNYHWAVSARLFRHDQYEHYLRTELIPLIRNMNAMPYLMATGCSFGAFHALNFALRHPGLINRVVALSGHYDIRSFFGDYYGDEVYFHNPLDYVPGINDHAALEALRRTDIIMATGRDDPHAWSNYQLSGALWNKGVGNALRIWDGWCHDWPYWQRMINQYIGGPD